jgi:hypothetical protein
MGLDLDQYRIIAPDAAARHHLMIWSETSQICDDDLDPLSLGLRPLASWIGRLLAWIKSVFF